MKCTGCFDLKHLSFGIASHYNWSAFCVLSPVICPSGFTYSASNRPMKTRYLTLKEFVHVPVASDERRQ